MNISADGTFLVARTNQAPGYNGSADITCNNGTWSVSAATCTATMGTCYYESGDPGNGCPFGSSVTEPSTAANCASACDGTFKCGCVFTP